jgi:hypothetical protein
MTAENLHDRFPYLTKLRAGGDVPPVRPRQ